MIHSQSILRHWPIEDRRPHHSGQEQLRGAQWLQEAVIQNFTSQAQPAPPPPLSRSHSAGIIVFAFEFSLSYPKLGQGAKARVLWCSFMCSRPRTSFHHESVFLQCSARCDD